MAVTQPMAFDYEIAAAIYFMLLEEYDELIVDIPRGEDSLFFKGSNIAAIGEAKNLSSNYWTIEALFHKGKKIGPILQLWIRDRENAKPAIFSTIGTNCPLEKKQLRPEPEEIRKIIESTKDLIEVSSDENYTFERINDFLKRVFFYQWPHRTVKSMISKWCRDRDIPTPTGGIERAIALFQDETYYSKKRIQREEIISTLSTEIEHRVRPSREYYLPRGAFVISFNCYGKIALELSAILRLHILEFKAQWYEPKKDVNRHAISILKERLETLKGLQERCGSKEITDLIYDLEKKPQVLFKENKHGESIRKRIRVIQALYTRLENDPTRMGELL